MKNRKYYNNNIALIFHNIICLFMSLYSINNYSLIQISLDCLLEKRSFSNCINQEKSARNDWRS